MSADPDEPLGASGGGGPAWMDGQDDPFASNTFTDELAGADQSVWDIDSDFFWGDPPADGDAPDAGLLM
ncbi:MULTISPECIES: hypothetical protein [unclassified Microbacterium]|uniref:hypothetical protein n=1 Tax=unclassified Microbacterium TaxID=2609290 RepID=UPI00203BD841|nr:hypothetical protein [Microbacterium sp. USTB-Y]MBS1907054.1 hypothetical protein [Actinomycetota bacterium]